MIHYNEQEKIFHLKTGRTSYVMGVYENTLLHLYWGDALTPGCETFSQLIQTKGRSFCATDLPDGLSTDTLPMEFPTFGSADLRTPALHVRYADGSRITRLTYDSYRILDGKPALEGLPATYAEEGDDVQTLEITLCDTYSGLRVVLSYGVFGTLDAITRSVRVENGGNDSVTLLNVMSACLDFQQLGMEMLHLPGAWARERFPERVPVMRGKMTVDSLRGASSALHNPFAALLEPDTTERRGRVWGMNLVYSGNFTAGAEAEPYGCTRAFIGIHPFDFTWNLAPGESFQSPEAVLVFSADGIGGMSRIFHRLYRTRLCRGAFRDSERYALINNWEATYFNFNGDKIAHIAQKAASVGLDLMVLDDGWFGHRDDDFSSLGDWYVDKKKLPEGLDGLAEKVNSMGMQFGLWFEPEMISEDSDLYRAHPDWCLHVAGRPRTPSRNQLILDLSRKDVCDYIIETITGVLKSAPIAYVKWDMNRNMSEVGSALLPAEQQGEVYHRYMLGLYRCLEAITSAFPQVLFESCSGGGGRFDPGMLYYMPQTWTSDDTDAVERLMIQYGTSICYPYSSMGCHVSAVPNHQVGRVTPIRMRGHVAMPGQLGYELDLNKLTDEEIEEVKQQVREYKQLGELFHQGDLYRLKNPDEGPVTALLFVSPDRCKAAFCLYVTKAMANAPHLRVRLDGLDETAQYRETSTGELYSGSVLMHVGLPCICDADYKSEIRVFEKL